MGIFDETYSSGELSKILGVHRVTVTNWIKMGALKAVKTPGGRYKVSKEDLFEFLKDRDLPIPPFLRIDNKKLVIAVDDDKDILKLLSSFFSSEKLKLFIDFIPFQNPIDAALFIGSHRPDIVLLDLFMPQLDGFELAKRIKETSSHTKIIVITGYGSEENINRIKEYGIEEVLKKPFKLKILMKIIEKLLI